MYLPEHIVLLVTTLCKLLHEKNKYIESIKQNIVLRGEIFKGKVIYNLYVNN